MTQDVFDKLIEALTEERKKIVSVKRPDYILKSRDVLDNFKRQSSEIDVDPLVVCYVFLRKHISAIGAYAKSPDVVHSEPIRGRIADAINYLELFHGLVQERQNEKNNVQERLPDRD